MKAKKISSVIEEYAPLSFQEKWDNSGYCIGGADQEVHSAIIALSCASCSGVPVKGRLLIFLTI